MDKIDPEKLKEANERTDLCDLAGRHITLKRESKGELSGPCPKCGGHDRFHVTADKFFCRQCFPLGNGKPHDAVEFVRWLGMAPDYVSAIAYLAGACVASMPRIRRDTSDTPPGTAPWQDEGWQRSAQEEAREAAERLLCHADGYTGREYLAERGITLEVAAAWGLGYAVNNGHPSLVIPWTGGGIVKAVQYRYISHPQGQRFTARPGSKRTIFGADLIGRTWDTLFLCEGELNAVSIWQALAELYQERHIAALLTTDVASFGSEGNLEHAVMLSRRYRQVLVWADREEITRRALDDIPGAVGIRSPLIDGKELDANALLKIGKLPELLARKLRPEGAP